jgi:glycosyltransferase involved in cell wall biosynthesis
VSFVSAISVILPTYNRASVLPRAIESVLEQSEADFELIIVDDGSTDETPRVLASIEDSRIQLLRSKVNRGGNWARNRGVERARAEVVSFLDSDDVYFPEKLEVMLRLFRENPEVDVWLDSFVCRDERDRAKPDNEKINPSGCSGADFRAGLFERTIAKATTAMSVRREALFEAGLFDETLHRRQDLDVILRLSKAHVCMTTDRVLWLKYETRDGISRDARTYLDAVIAICDRHPEYLRDHPAPLYRDLRSHFSKRLKRKEWKTFAVDRRRYRAYRPFEVSFLRLLLDPRIVRARGAGRSGGESQADSAQRSLNESGTPSRIAEVACAEARQNE